MAEVLQANWFLIVAALVIGLLVAWWIFVASRRTKVEIEDKDGNEGKAAKRNQALIDAPPAARRDGDIAAAAVPPTAEDTEEVEAARSAASPGPTSAAANTEATAAAPLGTDAETGDGVPMREALKATGNVAPAAQAPTQAPTPAPASGDDLRRIKGVGPKLVTILNEQGVTSFAQVAAWSEADIDRIDAQLGRFQGRIRRDSWVEQAKLLQAGNIEAYEAKFGRTA